MFNRPYMVIKKVCLEQNISWLVQLPGIRSFHAPFHLFSQCFYVRVISTKADISHAWTQGSSGIMSHEKWESQIINYNLEDNFKKEGPLAKLIGTNYIYLVPKVQKGRP